MNRCAIAALLAVPFLAARQPAQAETQPAQAKTQPAQAKTPTPQATVTVGIPGLLHGVVLPGSEFEAVPASLESKVVVRVAAVDPHGTAHRYDLEFTGFEPGDYDLREFLRRVDRTAVGELPPLPVRVTSALPAGQVEPAPLPSVPTEGLGGYRRTLWIAGGAWAVGLLLLLFVGRRRRTTAAVAAPPPTLAERLRPLVDAAIAGRLPPARLHELERLLLGHWRQRLHIEHLDMAAAIAQLRADAEAGALLRALERWLHASPAQRQPVDVEALLRPYVDVPTRSEA